MLEQLRPGEGKGKGRSKGEGRRREQEDGHSPEGKGKGRKGADISRSLIDIRPYNPFWVAQRSG